MQTTGRPRQGRGGQMPRDETKQRGNYDSGQDYVLEYGDLRFTFNERDFSERVEQAGRKLGFVGYPLEGTEFGDRVTSPSTARSSTRPPASASTSTTAGRTW